jgi:hypothetical protein
MAADPSACDTVPDAVFSNPRHRGFIFQAALEYAAVLRAPSAGGLSPICALRILAA